MHILKLLFIALLLVVNLKGQTFDTPELQSNAYELPDLIVTGLLWDTPVKNVAESVTLFSETALEGRQALFFQDLTEVIPNLTVTGGNNRSRYFQIRGLGENSQFEGETPDLSVRFLVDDFDFTGIGGIASLFDLKQVEVIRGAQTSAYGVNASAGIIKLSTNEANGESTSKLNLSIGTKNQRFSGYATGGTLGNNSKTNYRLTLSQNKSDGFIENEFLNKKDSNQSEETFSLLKFKYNPTSNSSIQTALVYADAKGGYDQWSLDNTYLKTQSDDPGEDNQRSKGISIRMNSENLKDFSVTSVTSILHTDSLYSYDSDWGNYLVDENFNLSGTSGYDGFLSIDRDRKSISQEIRIDSLEDHSYNNLFSKWTAGIYFNKLSEKSDINYLDNFDDDGRADVLSDYKTQSISLFSKAENKLDENSKISFGLRYEYQKVSFTSLTLNNADYSSYDEDADEWISTPTLDSGSDITKNDHLIGASINYENNLTDNYTLFLSYNRGYKAAGVNSTSFRIIDGASPLTFDTENVNTYEIGLVFLNPENTYQAKFNIFYLTRKNAQLRDAGGSKGFFNYFTSNQGDARHYGAEYHSQWSFNPDWSLETNLSLLKATMDNSSRDLANAPEYKYALLIKYAPESGFYSNLSLTGSADYYEENGHDLKREPYSVVNATIGYSNKQWDISLWAKNLFDHDYTKRVFYFDNYHPDDGYIYDSKRFYKASADPLNYGVTINYIW